MNETTATFPDPYVTTITNGTGVEHPKTDVEMTYLENKNIDEVICQKLKKKDV